MRSSSGHRPPTQSEDWTVAGRAYDAIAERYDEIPVENRINAHMRRTSLRNLVASFTSGMRILEIGCGTGDEALALAELGVHVTALDPSPEMLRVARSKAERRDLARRTKFLCIPAREIGALGGSKFAPFDGAFASFSLAYEPDLTPVVNGVYRLLAPGARFIASLPSRLCLVEWTIAMALGKPGLAGRRLRGSYDHKIGGSVAPIRSYTPMQVTRLFAPFFIVERVEALPAVVPPPFMNRGYRRLDGLADALERVDDAVRTLYGFRSLGDHTLFVTRRSSRPGEPADQASFCGHEDREGREFQPEQAGLSGA